MRFMVKCKLPADTANEAIMNGTMDKKLKAYIESVKPENVYLTLSHGQRTIYFIVDLPSESKMPALGEPMWLDFKADIYVTPVMTLSDFEKAGPDIERAAAERR